MATESPLEYILGIIQQIKEKSQKIPEDQIEALQTVEMLLAVIQAYQGWVGGLQSDVAKLNQLNLEKTEALKQMSN